MNETLHRFHAGCTNSVRLVRLLFGRGLCLLYFVRWDLQSTLQHKIQRALRPLSQRALVTAASSPRKDKKPTKVDPSALPPA